MVHSAVVLPWTDQDLRRALATARDRERAYTGALERLHRYDLLRRNCVTELFRTIDAALARAIAADTTTPAGRALVRAEATRRLGGHVEVAGSVNFIPFVAAGAVAASLRVTETAELPSYRREQLEHLYARENRLRVWLREANTLTATAYRPSADDSVFVFFTDDALLPRPLLGAVNLAAGLGASLIGLARLPADGGDTLRAGAAGVLFSLPELLFVNIRKGSYAEVPAAASP
jgi:hypothetical protein